MCGRYTLFRLNQLLLRFPWITSTLPGGEGRYNISPTEAVLVNSSRSPDRLDLFRWGMVPSWAKDLSVGNRMFNARAETLAERPAFRTALARRRCLIPADGFYEWKMPDKGRKKIPYHFTLRSGDVFAFAGLWDTWTAPDGSTVQSCALITTAPNELVAPVHNRMPAMLRPEHARRWIEREELTPQELAAALASYPAEEMEARPIERAGDLTQDAGCAKQQPEPTLFD